MMARARRYRPSAAPRVAVRPATRSLASTLFPRGARSAPLAFARANSVASSALSSRGAVSSAAPSNAAAGGANRGDADERLQAVLATWGRLIAMVRAARLAALGIAALALIDKAGALQALAAQPPPAGK